MALINVRKVLEDIENEYYDLFMSRDAIDRYGLSSEAKCIYINNFAKNKNITDKQAKELLSLISDIKMTIRKN